MRNLLAVFVLFFTLNVAAQINNSYLSNNFCLNQKDSNSFGIAVNSFNYLRNTEYYNKIEVGETLFGTQLQPTLWVQLDNNTKIQAGVFLNTQFGSSKIYQVLPVFTLTHTDKIGAFTFGSINGATAHNIIEPLFNINSAIENRIEQGAQYQINKPNLFFDTWINWRNFMPYQGASHEKFTAGIGIEPKTKPFKSLQVSVPFQFMLHHKGGQNSTDTSAQYSAINWAAGLKLKQEFTAEKFILLEHYFCYTANDAITNFTGTAHYFNASFTKNYLTFMASYFNGKDFVAPYGTYIYQSSSRFDANYYQKNRELLFLRFLYNKSLSNNLKLSCRFEPFYDFNNSQIDFSYSVYLNFNLSQKLARIKP